MDLLVHERLSLRQRLALAVGIFTAAIAIRFAILPVQSHLAFLTFYPATVLAFYFCGRGPGWLAGALSAVAGYTIFSPPFWSFAPTMGGVISTSVFLLSCALFSIVIGQLQTASADLRRAVGELRDTRRQHETILEQQSDWICRYRGDGTVVYANEAICRAFGLPRGAVVGSLWHPEVWHEDRERVEHSLRALSPEQPTVTIEKRVITAAGVRWAQFVDSASFDAGGRLVEIQKVGRDIHERKLLEERLQQSLEEYRDLYDNAPCGYHSLDATGRYTAINATELEWIGYRRDEVIGTLSPIHFLTEEGQATFRQAFPRLITSGRIDNLLVDLRHRNGTLRRVSVSATAVRDADGRFLMTRSVLHDVTEPERVKEQLRQLSSEQAAMLDHDLIGIFKTRDRTIIWNNRGLEQMFGYGPGELISRSSRCFHRDEASFEAGGEKTYALLKAGHHFRGQFNLVRKDGTPIWVEVGGVELPGPAGETLWMMTDVTASKHYQEQIERLAHYDALTGLPNRGNFRGRLERAIEVAGRGGQRLAVCVLDLDGFKPVNDTYGHAAGDEVLRVVAQRMAAALRQHDTVSRQGGDEFALLLTELQSPEQCWPALRQLAELIAQPIRLDGGAEVRVSASIGVSFYPGHGAVGDLLLKQADDAMYRAKGSGKACISIAGDESMPRPARSLSEGPGSSRTH